jgi:hypothetical protein
MVKREHGSADLFQARKPWPTPRLYGGKAVSRIHAHPLAQAGKGKPPQDAILHTASQETCRERGRNARRRVDVSALLPFTEVELARMIVTVRKGGAILFGAPCTRR